MAVQFVHTTGHWLIFEHVCRQSKATANLAQGAWFTPLAIESGPHWITTDGDFARFEGLTSRAPF
jgi:hypothetical protein